MENCRRQLKQDYLDIFDEAKPIITKAKTTFLTHAVQRGTICHAQIYLTAKIHKRKGAEEFPTRQIVIIPGSVNNGTSKWVDFYLNPVMNTIEWILKESFQLIHNIHKNTKRDLPDRTRLFSGNICNYYTKINEKKAVTVIKNFLEKMLKPSLYALATPCQLTKSLLR